MPKQIGHSKALRLIRQDAPEGRAPAKETPACTLTPVPYSPAAQAPT